MIKKLKLWLKMRYQKVTRGYTDYEIYNLDCTLTEWILPRLKTFKSKTKGKPYNLTDKEWDIILDKMIKAFELYRQEQSMSVLQREKDSDAIRDGLRLFGEYMYYLWW